MLRTSSSLRQRGYLNGESEIPPFLAPSLRTVLDIVCLGISLVRGRTTNLRQNVARMAPRRPRGRPLGSAQGAEGDTHHVDLQTQTNFFFQLLL